MKTLAATKRRPAIKIGRDDIRSLIESRSILTHATEEDSFPSAYSVAKQYTNKVENIARKYGTTPAALYINVDTGYVIRAGNNNK